MPSIETVPIFVHLGEKKGLKIIDRIFGPRKIIRCFLVPVKTTICELKKITELQNVRLDTAHPNYCYIRPNMSFNGTIIGPQAKETTGLAPSKDTIDSCCNAALLAILLK